MTSLPRIIGIAAVAALFTATLFAHAGAGTVSAVTPASLAIDADTSDGCATIESTATITQGTATSVGICIVDAASAPVDGFIAAASLYVTYTGPLTASNVAGNLTTDLNSNPNWNEAVGDGSGVWDCNQLNDAPSAPKATPSVVLVCDSGFVNVPVSGNVLLATLTFDTAGSAGTSTLAFGTNPPSDFVTGVDSGNNPVCGDTIDPCVGASIVVEAATDTPTATATNTATNTPTATNTSTPTATATFCANGSPCPTSTNTQTTTNPRTHTPTPTSSAVPTSTNTTVAGASATRPVGSAGAGATGPIRLPDTGAATNGASDGISQYVWLAMALVAAAALGGGMLLKVRRKQ